MWLPRERQHGSRGLQDLVVLGVVGDVLAEALLARPPQVDDRALALEVARHAGLQRLERVVLDLELQPGQALPVAHPSALPSRRLTSSSRRSSCRASPTAASSRAHSSIRVLPSLSSASVSSRLASPESSRRMISSTLRSWPPRS